MRISTGMTKNKIRAMLIIIAVVSAMLVMPVGVMANDGLIPDVLSMLRSDGQNMVLFDPTPGSFTEAEAQDGVRIVPVGQPVLRANFPQDPIREGYTFHGWRLSDSGIRVDGDLVLTDLLTTLEAIWYVYGQGPESTPAPSPPPQQSTTQSPTPTPTPPTAGAPNPPTNPITISLMIFGAVVALGIAAYGIVNLSMRHTVAVGKYRTNVMRYKRESRLEAILGIKNKKPRK